MAQISEARTARSSRGQARLSDPDRLVTDWEALLASHQHLHAPQAAQMLDVPESALVAARIGTGAMRLAPDIDRLLAPISQWGRVLCAFSNACGVHMPLGDVSARNEGDVLVLEGEHMRAQIDRAAIADAYLLVDHDDSHGNTKSVQFFDGAGNTIVKVFVFHKTRFAGAKQHLESFASSNQSRMIEPALAGSAQFDAQAASLANDPDGQPISGDVREQIVSLLANPGPVALEQIGASARVIWRGTIKGARMDDTMFHLHEPDIRSHLRFDPITSMTTSAQGALILKGAQGRLLRIQKGADQ